jgi:tetratricopeptide (TPR) repeat protein
MRGGTLLEPLRTIRYPPAMRNRTLLLPLILLLACSGATTTQSEETLMKAGLDALYTRHQPAAAVEQFRKVLEKNPSHYGATYQLAAALDAAGKPDEASVMWQKVLPMAEAAQDRSSADRARARLAQDQDAKDMQVGLDALYKQHQPDIAAAQFRKILARNPTHYGATYQLAAALDAAGKKDEARPLWEKVVQMADRYNDQSTARTARARLDPGSS